MYIEPFSRSTVIFVFFTIDPNLGGESNGMPQRTLPHSPSPNLETSSAERPQGI